MKVALFILLLATVALSVSEKASALEPCKELAKDPDRLARDLKEIALRRTPSKYYDLAQTIVLSTTAIRDSQLIPFTLDEPRQKTVIFPARFAVVVCKIALAQYIAYDSGRGQLIDSEKFRLEECFDTSKIEDCKPLMAIISAREKNSAFFDDAGLTAATCLNKGGTETACLSSFADDLETRYEKMLLKLTATKRDFLLEAASDIYEATISQILMHEYAHLFLDHHRQILSKQLSQADAEFRADMFAVLNGAQVGETTSAMAYFFDPLSSIEKRTRKLESLNNETNACRSSNVHNVLKATGLAQVLILAAADLSEHSDDPKSLAAFRWEGKMDFSEAGFKLDAGSCAKIATEPLGVAHDELHRLYVRMGNDLDNLYRPLEKIDADRMSKLLIDLADMAKSFKYMEGLAAKCIGAILSNWRMTRQSTLSILRPIDSMLKSAELTGNLISVDFGRVLQAEGLSILQEDVDRPVDIRLDLGASFLQRAVFYNPAQTESWSNLAFVMFRRGDCVAASQFADKAVATLTSKDQDDIDNTKWFAAAMKRMSTDHKLCAAEAKMFHYPRL